MIGNRQCPSTTEAAIKQSKNIPLCVDLDGTLVKLDTLHQSFFLLLRKNSGCIFKIPGWLLKGRAYFKEQVMQRVELEADLLPYNTKLLEWLRQEHRSGRKLILATASNHRTARAVAAYLGIFEDILASDEENNLRHEQKLKAIQEKFPCFAYAGNDRSDFPIWAAAKEVILVNPVYAVKRSRLISSADQIFIDKRPLGKMFIEAIRCRQWLKNILVFTPIFLAHRFSDFGSLFQTVTAFFSFSLAASSIYVVNDLFDLSADQHHPRKRKRPFAAGDLSIITGVLLVPVLSAASIMLCVFLPLPFFFTLIAYYMLTTLYSWRLKKIAIADVFILAVLFSIRIFAGSTATETPISEWLIEFSVFFFMSLALAKRSSELREINKYSAENEIARRERGYQVNDLLLLISFGVASGYIAVLVFTTYLHSEKVENLYSRPWLLWIFCPLLLYWITRVWYLTWNGKMDDDPLAFATRDPQSYLISAIGITALLCAI